MAEHVHALREDAPSLDELVANPESAARLSPPDAQRVALRCLAVLSALCVVETRPDPPAVEQDRLIGSQEVADLIGMSRSWVEKHPDRLPPRRSVEGSPRWVRSEIVRWMKNRPVYGGRGLR